jgi:ERCC4-related helicase
MDGIKIVYITDNEDWSDERFEEEQENDKVFIITPEMINDLLKRHLSLEEGEFIAEFYPRSF